ncbi:hypothetical protein MHTCC0001_04520 [Flavobacteriaceae bacterium MHTCC 0001]
MERKQDIFDNIEAYLSGELKGESLKAFKDVLNVDEALKQEVEKQKHIQERYETIERFLGNRLREDDLKSFQDSFNTDKLLQEEVERHQLIQNALKDKDSFDFRKKLLQIDTEIKEGLQHEHPVTVKKMDWRRWRVVAVIALMIGVTSLLIIPNYASKSNTLFEAYYVPYPMEAVTRGDEISGDMTLSTLATYYRNENYKKVIMLFESNKHLTNDDKLKLYFGNAYLNENDTYKAIELLQSIQKDSKFYNDAQWFLALVYVKIEDKDKALRILSILSKSSNLYTKKALHLNKALK